MSHCSLVAVVSELNTFLFFCLVPLQRGQLRCLLKGTAHQTGCKEFDGQRHVDVMSSCAAAWVSQPGERVQPFIFLLTYFLSDILCFPSLFSTKSAP